MNIFRTIKSPVFAITFGLSVAVAMLIITLVPQVTSFSRKVTDFSAPTIYSVKSFADRTLHAGCGLCGNHREGLSRGKGRFRNTSVRSDTRCLWLLWCNDEFKTLQTRDGSRKSPVWNWSKQGNTVKRGGYRCPYKMYQKGPHHSR